MRNSKIESLCLSMIGAQAILFWLNQSSFLGNKALPFGTVVIPASLAIGDFRNCTGKELIAAVALGYEILFRLTDGAGG